VPPAAKAAPAAVAMIAGVAGVTGVAGVAGVATASTSAPFVTFAKVATFATFATVAGLLAAASPAARAAAPAAMGPPALPRAPGLASQVLTGALDAVAAARARGVAGRDDILTVIDFSLPSTQPRLWVLDLAHDRVLFHELVAHGSGSGDNFAVRFSNAVESRQSSLGLFLTGDTYLGAHGYSLHLQGLDAGVNDRAEERHIVFHGAWYVSVEQARRYGRLGRSWGCPALPEESAHAVIDAIKGGTFVFAYSALDPKPAANPAE
jgi:hypothetical protein